MFGSKRSSSQSFENAHPTDRRRTYVQCSTMRSRRKTCRYLKRPDTMQMSSDDDVSDDAEEAIKPPARIGYCSPPVHSQFKQGQSGNPSGRAKGSQNLKTLFNKVLDEEISLRDG